MQIPYYTRTAGLERYPQNERFAVYRAMHQRLLSEDPEYHRRWIAYIGTVMGLIFIPIVGWLLIVRTAFRQQAFQNQKIGDALQVAA